MSKGGPKTKVNDYRMSIHFGVCYGAVDSINQIYVKELPIWCGKMTSPGSFSVNLPELFGGNLAEGGVVGDLDVYFGTDDQMMFTKTADHYGLTPTTMPGYRQLANIFFRGAATGDGFKWSSNNPYLPATWVNATRLPKQLSVEFSAIYPYGRDYTEEALDPPPSNTTITRFPISMGAVAEDIDAGLVHINYSVSAGFTYTSILTGAAPGLVQLQMHFFNEAGSEMGGTAIFLGGSVTGSGSQTVSMALPAGCRKYTVRMKVLATFPIFTAITKTLTGVLSYPSYGPSWCNMDGTNDDATLSSLPQANPAHMIYEALTDDDLGMGAEASQINTAGFMAAAETYYNEGLGLTILWSDQTPVEQYIQEILDHIASVLFLDPRDGKWNLVPLRADYDFDTLPILNPSNSELENPQRKGLGETINEVVVEWTNPDSEETQTITYQDPANIAAQGGIITTTRNFYGVRYPELADQLGQREIRSLSYPLYGTTAYVDRTVGFLHPGSVARLQWPDDGIDDMVVRVGTVDYGMPGDSRVKLALTEDIFGLELAIYSTVQKTKWTNPDLPPTPFDHVDFMTAPLALYIRAGHSITTLEDSDYPVVPVDVLAKRDAGGTVSTFTLLGEGLKPNGETTTVTLGRLMPTPSDVLTAALPWESRSTISGDDVTNICKPLTPDTGTFLWIGSGDATGELAMLDTYDSGSNVWTLARGMYDTVSKAWPVGTRVWYLQDYAPAIDPSEESDGATATYWLLPTSSGGTLAQADATAYSFTPSGRPYYPNRPANVTVSYTPTGTSEEAHPIDVQNPGAESQTSGVPNTWACTNVSSVTSVGSLYSHSGSRFFTFGGTTGVDADMSQMLSISRSLSDWIDDGLLKLRVNWFTATSLSSNFGTDAIFMGVTFYDEAGGTISSATGGNHFASALTWVLEQESFDIPPLARSYLLTVNAHKTAGTTHNSYVDDISVDFLMDGFPVFGFTGSERPTNLTFSWANRNRLMEDTLAPRWTEGNVTPEDGQTVTLRVRDHVTGGIEAEVTGLTGTSYSLDISGLTVYRDYRIEVLAVRDGFESLQWFSQPLVLTTIGYGFGYGYDYGSP